MAFRTTPQVRRASRLNVYERTLRLGIVAAVAATDAAERRRLMESCLEAGVDVIELDLDVAGLDGVAADVAWSQRHAPKAIAGAGPVDTVSAFEQLAEAGVRFVRVRGDVPELARACNLAGIAYVPTCSSEAERDAARGTGAELVVVGLEAGTTEDDAIGPALGSDPGATIVAPANPPDPGLVESIAAAGSAGVRIPVLTGSPGADDSVTLLERSVSAFRRGRGDPLFSGIEHTGLYPIPEASDTDITSWYVDAFGFPLRTMKTHFLGNGTDGRIEVMREQADAGCHLAVTVRDFDEAVESLRSRGYALEEAVIGPTSRVVYLTERDPAGNLVHLIWRP